MKSTVTYELQTARSGQNMNKISKAKEEHIKISINPKKKLANKSIKFKLAPPHQKKTKESISKKDYLPFSPRTNH